MRNKYGAKRTEVDGITFHSKKEAMYYIKLKALQGQGLIKSFERQVKYTFGCGVRYYLDFLVHYSSGETVYYDVKGMKKHPPEYIIKKKLMKHEFGIDITEV